MAQVLIVYATDYGNTQKMAQALAEGARSVSSTQVEVKLAEEVTADDLLKSDAVIVGTPVHMGSPDWRVKKLIDTVCSHLWMTDSLIGFLLGLYLLLEAAMAMLEADVNLQC